MTYEIETHRRVYDNDNGHYVTIRPSPDIPGNVLLVVDESQEAYIGTARLDLPSQFMLAIGEALIAAAREAGHSA